MYHSRIVTLNDVLFVLPLQQNNLLGPRGQHVFRNRLRKTLYYGQYADATLPSFPVTGG